MSRAKCIICGKTLPGEGQEICSDCMAEKSDIETTEELWDIADVLSITVDTDANIKKTIEAIMRIASRIDRRVKSGKKKEQASETAVKKPVADINRIRKRREGNAGKGACPCRANEGGKKDGQEHGERKGAENAENVSGNRRGNQGKTQHYF